MYLDQIGTACSRLDAVIAPTGYVLVEIATMKHEDPGTTLAWDVADSVSHLFRFDGNCVITWERETEPTGRTGAFGTGSDHSYSLVVRADTDGPVRASSHHQLSIG